MSASKRGANWTVQEDEALCTAWLNTSQDASIGVNQRAQTLYDRVYTSFLQICTENQVSGNPELRAPPGIKARWHLISKVVSKFSGYLAQIQHRCQSGASPEDMIKQAIALFAASEKTAFTLMHCYAKLQNAPKWQLYISEKMSTSRKRSTATVADENDELPELDENVNQPSPPERPMGQKAAKARKIAVASAGNQMAEASNQLAAIAKERLCFSKQKAQALTRIANHNIMSMNLEGLSGTAREYYLLEQHRILIETRQSATSATDAIPDARSLPSEDDDLEIDPLEEVLMGEEYFADDD